MSRTVFLLVNGIEAKGEGTISEWQQVACRWINSNTDHLADRYDNEVRFWERSIEEDQHAANLADLVRDWQDRIGGCNVNLVGHSNGAAIICAAIARHEEGKPDICVDTLHLIQGAVSGDFRANGLNDAIEAGRVKRVVWYWSRGDTVLKGVGNPLMRAGAAVLRFITFGKLKGYANGGYTGPSNLSDKAKACLIDRQDDAQDHSSRLTPGTPQFVATMRQITDPIEILPTFDLDQLSKT